MLGQISGNYSVCIPNENERLKNVYYFTILRNKVTKNVDLYVLPVDLLDLRVPGR